MRVIQKTKKKPFNTNVTNRHLKANLKKFLFSKLHAGGLYGLTISDENFIPELIQVINLSANHKRWDKPVEEEELASF